MIIIYTDRDLGGLSGMDFDAVQLWCVSERLRVDHWAEDVYFWRKGEIKALKRLNARLVVPEWIKQLEGVR